jgi:hypothetical protein
MDDLKFPEGLPRFQFTPGELVPGRVELVPGEPLATERTALAILEELRAIRAEMEFRALAAHGGVSHE